jgi:hypothetical protein
VNRLEAQAFFAQLAREGANPRDQWQKLARWLDALPLAQRMEAVRFSEKALKIDFDARVPTRAWLASLLAGDPTPQFYLVRNLSLGQFKVREKDVVRILTSPFLGPLRRIKLFASELSDACVDHLIACPRTAMLVALNLSANRLSAAAIEKLIAADAFPKLRELYLGRNQIDDRVASALCTSTWPSRLSVLELRDNPISAHAQEQLRSCAALAKCVVSLPDDEDN